MENLIGQRFGHWTVLKEAPSIVSPCGTKRKAFLCRCDCGTEKIVSKTLLKNGKTTSCGCRGSFLLPGENYGEWTVIKRSAITDAHNSQFYECKCSCGVIRSVRMSDLKNGSSKNCGHNRYTLSKGAQAIKNLLINLKIPFYQEYVFKDFKKYRYDFAVYENNKPDQIKLLIEFDGEQHFRKTGGWNNQEAFEKRIEHDIEKNKYALEHNIPLVRIPFYILNPTKEDIFGIKFLIDRRDYY